MALSDEWRDKVTKKLVQIFECDEKKLTDIFWYLTNGPIQANWTTLKSLLNFDEAFKLFAMRIADEAAKFKLIAEEELRNAYRNLAEEVKNEVCQSEQEFRDSERLALATIQNFEYFQKKLTLSMPSINVKNYSMLISVFKSTIASMDDIIGLYAKSANITVAGLAAVFLSIDAILNIWKYWKGEISGRRCCKNILDSTFTLASGFAGTFGGGLVGSLAGPVGTLVGGLVGGLITTYVANYLFDYLTLNLFGIPKDIALDNAYNYFGIKMTASNSELNRAYRRMCLKHHPDKGGKKEDFFIVQVKMQVIKTARECEKI